VRRSAPLITSLDAKVWRRECSESPVPARPASSPQIEPITFSCHVVPSLCVPVFLSALSCRCGLDGSRCRTVALLWKPEKACDSLGQGIDETTVLLPGTLAQSER